MTDDPLLSVTMTESAAAKFIEALNWAEAQVDCTSPPPLSPRQQQLIEYAEWLRWGIGRVNLAAYEQQGANGR